MDKANTNTSDLSDPMTKGSYYLPKSLIDSVNAFKHRSGLSLSFNKKVEYLLKIALELEK